MTKVFLTHHLENSRCEVALVTALATVALATAAIAIDALPMDLFSAPPQVNDQGRMWILLSSLWINLVA